MLINDVQVAPEDVLILDTETTGLSYKDEVLQLSIINGAGKKIFNEYIKPVFNKKWEEAEKINHITHEMVADKNTLKSYQLFILGQLFQAKYIVGYNIAFDLKMLAQTLDIPSYVYDKALDVMDAFSIVKNDRIAVTNALIPHPLKDCAEFFNYVPEPQHNYHDSLEDCRATLHCFNKLLENSVVFIPLSQQDDFYVPNSDHSNVIVRFSPKALKLLGEITGTVIQDNGDFGLGLDYPAIYKSSLEDQDLKDRIIFADRLEDQDLKHRFIFADRAYLNSYKTNRFEQAIGLALSTLDPEWIKKLNIKVDFDHGLISVDDASGNTYSLGTKNYRVKYCCQNSFEFYNIINTFS